MHKFILSIIISAVLFSLIPGISLALTASEIKQQIKDTNAQIAGIEREIESLSKQITKTVAEKNSLANTIRELNLKRNQLIKERESIQKKINATGLLIQDINNNISSKERSIVLSRQALASSIRDLYRNDNTLLIEKLVAEGNLSSFSREYNNILSVNQDIKNNIYEILGKKEELLASKNEKELEQQNLNNLKRNLVQQEQVIASNQKEKNTLLKQTENKESSYQKLLAEQIKKRDAFEKDLAKYEDQLKFVLNPKKLPQAGTEVLAWPLKNVFITQLFGYTSDSVRLYRSGTHSGVDFRASVGTEVYAMADGTIIGTGDTDIYCKGASFGKWVFIKYDNGLSSTFGHLSVIYAKTGDRVKAGSLVALSGNTGHTTGPHLHVTVYASDGAKVDKVPSLSCSGKTFIMPIAATSSYLDPMLYLPKLTKGTSKN
ncbi:MAG: hypothetical protein EOM85_00460 [Candidatus Moranbacteria bacterium]|nr:hypothetical protein [Candidatus Moranbacteria bacterium]